MKSSAPRRSLVRWGRPVVGLFLLLPLLLSSCAEEEVKATSESVALELLDVYPYPAVNGPEGDSSEHLAPLRNAYLVYIRAENFPLAAKMFGEAFAEHPDLVEASFLRGVSLVLAKEPAQAVPALEAVLEVFPEYSPAHWFLGQAYFALDRDEEALAQMKRVRDIGFEYSEAAASVLAGEN